jgi:protein-tyrosine phosphatase
MIEEACFQITQKDIKPILAHPQRYQMIKDISAYKELKNKGFYFQLNALSLLGALRSSGKAKSRKIFT